ncbi:MAG: hypothetical protein ABSG17_07640 [Spirochaetia bacterium]|jgi:hypothetical protein
MASIDEAGSIQPLEDFFAGRKNLVPLEHAAEEKIPVFIDAMNQGIADPGARRWRT